MALSSLPQSNPVPASRTKLGGQLDGYWVEPGDEVAAVRPPYDPTGAILLAQAEGEGGTRSGLSLVRRNDGTFGPVSHAAVLTYFHTTGMADGEVWRFAIYDADRPPIVYECVPPLGEAPVEELARTFGDEAARRARTDYPTVIFLVRPVDGQRV